MSKLVFKVEVVFLVEIHITIKLYVADWILRKVQDLDEKKICHQNVNNSEKETPSSEIYCSFNFTRHII